MNVRKLAIAVSEVENMKVIFSTPKKQSKVLQFSLHEGTGTEEVKKAMDLCASGTTYVEKLIYSGLLF